MNKFLFFVIFILLQSLIYAQVQVPATNQGIANASPGDYIIRSDGEKVVLTRMDINYSKKQLGLTSTTTQNTPTTSNRSNTTQNRSTTSSSSNSTNAQRAGANDNSIFIFGFILLIIFIIGIEWLIGKAIGKAISRNTGIILGIVLMLLGFSVIVGIAIIVFSNKNKEEMNINVNLNMTQNYGYNNIRNVTPNNSFNVYENRQMLGQSGTMNIQDKRCRSCGKMFSGTYGGCPYCGSSLYETINQNTSIGPITRDDNNIEKKKCRLCNQMVRADIFRCPSCGGDTFV